MKKLVNKTTGDIGRLSVDMNKPDNGIRVYYEDGVTYKMYNSLAELNEKWEDMPVEEYWFINDLDGNPIKCEMRNCSGRSFTLWSKKRKEIGNHFETKEETEKAVEKLKAWTRLEANGFRFTGFEDTDRGCLGDFTIYCSIKPDYTRPQDEVEKDLDLLFGGDNEK